MDSSRKLSFCARVGLVLTLVFPVAACSGPPRFVAGGARESIESSGRSTATSDRAGAPATVKEWQKVYKDLLGIRYAYGGSSRNGFDCSGLVQYAYQKFDGRRLPRTVQSMFGHGEQVRRTDLRAGDLVFYDTGGRSPSHVGIYVEHRSFLHASVSGGVELSSMDESYYSRRYVGARRLKSR